MKSKKVKTFSDTELIALLKKSGMSSSSSTYLEDHVESARDKIQTTFVMIDTPVPLLKHLFGGPVTDFAKEFCSSKENGTYLFFDPHLPAKFSAMLLVVDNQPDFRIYNPTVSLEVGGRLCNLIPVTALATEAVTYE